MSREVLRLLDSLGDLQVVESIPPLPPPQTRVMGPMTLGCFRVRHEARLESWRRGLSGDARPQSLILRGRVNWLLGRTLEAQRDLERGLAGAPGHARGLCYLGILWLGLDVPTAAGCLRGAVAADPRWPWSRLWLAAASLARPTGARRALAQLERFRVLGGPPCPLMRFLRAIALLDTGAWRDARREGGALAAAAPWSPAGYAVRFQARLALGDIRGAVSDHNRARTLDPDCAGFDLLCEGVGERRPRLGPRRRRLLAEALRRRPAEALLAMESAELSPDPHGDRRDLTAEEYRMLGDRYPGTAWILAHEARARGFSGGPGESLGGLDRALRLAPRAGWIYAWRGEAKRRLGRLAEALRDFDKAGRLMPWYGYSHVWKGGALLSLGRPAEALRNLHAGLWIGVDYPANAFAFNARHLARRALGDGNGAVEDLTEAFKLDGKYTWVPNGPRPASQEALARAAAELSGASRKNPWAMAWRGYVDLRLGRFSRAVRELSRACARDPGNAWALVWRGLAHRSRGSWARAQRDFRTALRLDPGQWGAAMESARLLARRGRWAQALGALDLKERRGSVPAAFFAQRAELLMRLGRPRESLEEAAKALRLDRGYAEALALSACALSRLGDPAGALGLAESALAIKTELPFAFLARGLARGGLGDSRGRSEDIEEACRMDPSLRGGLKA